MSGTQQRDERGGEWRSWARALHAPSSRLVLSRPLPVRPVTLTASASALPGPAAHTPVPAPPPRPPAPARIDQVRAELDELSDYLRRQDGGHEGGR